MNFNLSYNGAVYGFTRDSAGNGFWYCVQGRVPGVIGKCIPGMMVPTILSTELSKEAVRQGLASYQDLARQLRKEKKAKPKAVRVAAKPKKHSTLLSSFNPFSLENSVKSDTQIEIEQALEKLKTTTKRKRITDEEETTEIFADLFSPDNDFDDEEEEDIETLDLEEIEGEVIDVERGGVGT